MFWAVLLSNQLFLKVFGRGDRQKDFQSREVGSPEERDLERGKPLLPKEEREDK